MVDDSALGRRIVRASFEQTSWTVHEAGERHDGVAKTRKLNTGVIVLDLVMPVTYLLFSLAELKPAPV